VRYLFRLRDALFGKLESSGLMDAYTLQNRMLQDEQNNKVKLAKYEKAKGYRRLDKKRRELFKEIFTLRDSFAKRLNKPPDYVFSNVRLLELCKDGIQDPAFVVQGINPRIKRSIQDEILGRFTEILQSRLGASDDR
jgi:ribonuclease D